MNEVVHLILIEEQAKYIESLMSRLEVAIKALEQIARKVPHQVDRHEAVIAAREALDRLDGKEL